MRSLELASPSHSIASLSSVAAVVVVGGKLRVSAVGTTRSSAVVEAVRKHSQLPVLHIPSEHPLLEIDLPPIAEELPQDASRTVAQQTLHRSCSLTLPPLAEPSHACGAHLPQHGPSQRFTNNG